MKNKLHAYLLHQHENQIHQTYNQDDIQNLLATSGKKIYKLLEVSNQINILQSHQNKTTK